MNPFVATMSSELDSVDSQIADHYQDPYHFGNCEGATHQAEGKGSLSGDRVAIDLRIDERSGVLEEAWFEADGSVYAQAAASILVEYIEGLSREQLSEFSATRMLELFETPIPVNLQKSGLLPWRVLQAALESPIHQDDEDGVTFGGPHLGEEN